MVPWLTNCERKCEMGIVRSDMRWWRLVVSAIAYYGARHQDSRREGAETASALCGGSSRDRALISSIPRAYRRLLQDMPRTA